MTIFANLACTPVADNAERESERNSFRRARRSSGASSTEIDRSGKGEQEPEHVIRRLKYERDLLKHQLSITKRQQEELSFQVEGMRYSSSCPNFPPYITASPRGNPLSPSRSVSSPSGFVHSASMDEAGAEFIGGNDVLIPASYPSYSFGAIAIHSAASSPIPGLRCPGHYMSGTYGSTTSLLDFQRPRPPLHVTTGVPRSRGTTPPASPQEPSPNFSAAGAMLDALDSIASSCSEAIRSDLQLVGLDLDDFENPDRKRADELHAEVERLQQVLDVERQERKGLDCRIRELEHIIEELKQDNRDLVQQTSPYASKVPALCNSSRMGSEHPDCKAPCDQQHK